jgi:hypothetical protein
MTRAEQAAVLAARFREQADLSARSFMRPHQAVLGDFTESTVRDATADALAELADLVAWIVDQLEPVQ